MPNSRIERMQQLLAKHELDAYFVSGISNVRYLSNYPDDEAYLLLSAAGSCTLITDFRYEEVARESCPDCEIYIKQTGFTLADCLADICRRQQAKAVGFEPDQLTFSLYKAVADRIAPAQLVEKAGLVEQLRLSKDLHEQELMREACRRTDTIFESILPYIAAGKSERELEWQLLTLINAQGCKPSFPPIVVSGSRGSLPHGVASDKLIATGEFVTMDFGCIYNGYCSDMTRTVHVGQPDEQHRKIYDIVLQANLKGQAAVKAGASCQAVDAAGRDYIAAEGYGQYFGHSLGHGVGLQVHEAPSVSPASSQILAAGSFITVEPGIYIPGWGGLRIEDTVLVTEEGCEVMFGSTKEMIIT